MKITCHHLKKSPESIKINREMLQHVKRASSRYREDLQLQREQKESNSKELKRKIVDDEIKAVKAKRRILQSGIESLTKESDKLAIKAEKHSNFDLLKESIKRRNYVKLNKRRLKSWM